MTSTHAAHFKLDKLCIFYYLSMNISDSIFLLFRKKIQNETSNKFTGNLQCTNNKFQTSEHFTNIQIISLRIKWVFLFSNTNNLVSSKLKTSFLFILASIPVSFIRSIESQSKMLL